MGKSVTFCDHCGRDSNDRVMGHRTWTMECPAAPLLNRQVTQDLCHANLDGTKADPDCYHLVTIGVEKLGSRL